MMVRLPVRMTMTVAACTFALATSAQQAQRRNSANNTNAATENQTVFHMINQNSKG
jgi:hypothetical protein